MGPAVCDVTFVVEVLYLKYSLRSYKNKIRFQTYIAKTINISKIYPRKKETLWTIQTNWDKKYTKCLFIGNSRHVWKAETELSLGRKTAELHTVQIFITRFLHSWYSAQQCVLLNNICKITQLLKYCINTTALKKSCWYCIAHQGFVWHYKKIHPIPIMIP